MSPIIEYGHGISAIDSGYKRAGLAAIYLLIEGDRAAFIDTGTNHSLPAVMAALAANGLAPENVEYVIPTHAHLDHAGGAGAMMQRFPRATLVAHPRAARHLIDPSKLIAGVTEVYGADEAARSFGAIVPIPAERVIEAPDDFTLDFNGRPLRFLDTPGHARHHFCVWDERSASMFTGDTFGISYREFDTDSGAFIFPTTTPVQFEPEALHASVDRLAGFRPARMCLTHFGAVTGVDRLAHDMHEMIDALVAMARSKLDSGTDRHARLVRGQRDILLPRLTAHGCRLTPRITEALLAGDYELNAQGIGIWLDRAGR